MKLRHLVLFACACTRTSSPPPAPSSLAVPATPTAPVSAPPTEARAPGWFKQGPFPEDAERDRAIHERFGARCRLERTCGPLWGVDCDAAVDGPYFYVRPGRAGLEIIATCGGACMGGRCTDCPPTSAGWTCPVY